MALFGPKKEDKAAAENEVMRLLSQSEYLSRLMDQLLIITGKKEIEIDGEMTTVEDKDKAWLTECQSYYDDRYRKVVVEPDGFTIKWSDYHSENRQGADGKVYTETVEDIYEKIFYRYTADGYMPLHEVGIGDIKVNRDTVVLLWALVIREKMIALFPELDFNGSVQNTKSEASFTYFVPRLEWKDWF